MPPVSLALDFGNVYGGEIFHKMFTIVPGFEWIVQFHSIMKF